MKYIKIQNDGEIENNAFYLIGASTKRGSEKIGFFGSGLKYSLAVLLRNEIGFSVYSGLREIKITTKKTEFRGKPFNQIYINNKPTGFTSEMGIDWESWFPIREIFCNAIDEGGNPTLEFCEETVPVEGKTIFFIELKDQTKEIVDNWDKYFSLNRNDSYMRSDDINIFHGSDEYIIYRRGVQVYHQKKKSLFHYDCKNLDINESRTLKHGIDAYWEVAIQIAKHANKEVIKRIFDFYNDTAEAEYHWIQANYFNNNWLDVINGRYLVLKSVSGYFQKQIADGNCLVLPDSLVNSLSNYFKDKILVLGKSQECGDFVVIEANEKQKAYIDQALVFLFNCNIKVDSKINVAVFKDGKIFGQVVNNNEILLSVNLFDNGKRQVIETLLEEHIHIKHQVPDESRAMQNVLLNKIVCCFEDMSKQYL